MLKKLIKPIVIVGVLFYVVPALTHQEKVGGSIDETELDKVPQEQGLSWGDEKAKQYLEWIDTPVGTASPFTREDGSNVVIDNMRIEDETMPNPENDVSPFFNPDTGRNVVRDNMIKEEIEENKLP